LSFRGKSNPNRKLTVFHRREIDQIEEAVIELYLGGKKLGTEQTEKTDFKEHENHENYFGQFSE
jgi:hypothetical protein